MRRRAIVALVAGAMLVPNAVGASFTWMVSADGSTDHDTISAAIEAAAPYDQILIAPGTYVEALVLDKDIVIAGQGDGSDVVIEPPKKLQRRNVGFEEEAFEVLIYAEDSDVSVHDVSLGEVVGYGIAVVGGSADIRGVVSQDEIAVRGASPVTVTGSDLLALWVDGPGEVLARGNTLHEGALVLGGAHATFEDNEVRNFPIVADGGASITVTGNTFTPADDDVGVVVVDPESAGHITDNHFSGGWVGVILEFPVETTVEDNRFEGLVEGIVVVESGAVVRDNTFTGTTDYGVHTVGEGMTVEGNVIEGSRVGLFAEPLLGESHPRATDYQEGPFVSGNTITGASHFGVLVEGVPAELAGNTICAGRQPLKIQGESSLVLGTNDICEPEAE